MPKIKADGLKDAVNIQASTVPNIKGNIPTVWKGGRERVSHPPKVCFHGCDILRLWWLFGRV